MGNKIRIKQIDLQGIISASGQVSLLSASNYVSFVTQLDTTMSSDVELAAASSSISQSIYTINQIVGSGLISGSSQLTSSYDTRYVLSGSITQTTWDNIDGKPSGLVSQSTDLTPLNSKTGSYATTSSNQFDGNQTITGSIIATSNIQTVNGYVQTNLLYNGGPIEIRSFYQPLQINSNGAGTIVNDNTDISGSLRISGSIFSNGIGLISGSSQLTSSYDSRYFLNSKTASLATTGSNVFIGNQIITGSVSILIPGGSAYAINENPSSNNEFWAYIVDYPAAQNVAVGWTATIVGGGTYTVTAVNYQHPFNKITLSDGSLTMGYRIGINFSKSSKLWEFNTEGTLTGLPAGLVSGSSQLTSSFDGRYTLTSSFNSFTASYFTDSASVDTRITTEKERIDAILSASSADKDSFAEIVTLINSVDTTNDNAFASFYTSSNSRISSLESVTSSYETKGSSIISGSSQLTSSFDTRYTLSGSVQPLPNGLISGSSQLTASYDTRYLLSGSSTSRVFASDNAPSSPTQGDLWWKTNDGNLYVYYDSYWIVATDTISALPNGLVSGSSQLPTLATTGSNTFTGTNTFNNIVTIGGSSGAEGGELRLAYAETGNTLTGSAASIDIYQNRLRIFEGGGNARGAHLDLSKLPAGVTGELMWKASGMVNAGTFVTLDNIKATVTSGSPYGLSIAAVSTTFSANISAYHAYTGGIAGTATNNQSITTTPTTSLFGWSFPAEGDGAYYTIVDKTNSRMYRITMMIGASYLNNFISIERLF